MQHAREWLAGETCRRTLAYFTTNYGKDPQVTRLVDTRELWFMCVANPDGYEYTFTEGNRLWRKNMANNDGGPRGGVNDGVDPNRNFPRNWGLDDEGSSSALDSETYRGPSAGSEPETKAMIALMDKVDFAFQKNDHTAASLLLYPQGFQQYTPTADDAIFSALAGDDADPAIDGFDPDLGAELYITNGDTNDYAYAEKQILSYTPEGTRRRTRASPGSSSRTRSPRSRPSSGAIWRSRSTSRSRPRRRRSRSRTSATRSRTSTSTRSPTPTAIRSRCRSPRSARSARS